MIEVRRRLHKESFEADYISDGLVLFLDGINKGSEKGWVDLVKGKFYENKGATLLEDGFLFDKNSYLKGEPYPYKFNNCTIEVVICNYSNTEWCSVIAGGYPNTNNIAYQSSMDGGTTFAITSWGGNTGTKGAKYSYEKDMTNIKLTSSAHNVFAITNYEENKNVGEGAFTAVSNSIIGGRCYNSESLTGNGKFIGSIHCIRIYDRLLSREEMLHNQQLDNIRFNLGL